MTARSRPELRVVIASSPGTFQRVGARLRRHGWLVYRAEVIERVPVRLGPPPGWLTRRPPPDVWVVTSRGIAREFWSSNPAWRPALRRIPTVLAVGPATAAALRRVGLKPRVERTGRGSDAMIRAAQWMRNLRVVYLRSDRAGPRLARHLRRLGARVRERVVYRVRDRGSALSEPLEGARAWLVGSPSALEAIRRGLGARRFRQAAGRLDVFVLGERTARAARRLGVPSPRIPRASSEELFGRRVVEALGDAPP